ncbi:DUF1254 domain-containing protein [Syntrophotalea acetylenica]|nr:DUF1254 domain-containing protein [Syntrophotalea acetylenica]APG44320.1 hypothetical protein A6070_09510 [Syntrophotalea acetylenica]
MLRKNRVACLSVLAAVLLSAALWFGEAAGIDAVTMQTPAHSDTLETAIDAYIYGYPLVLIEFTRQIMLTSGQLQAMNQFTHTCQLLTPDDTSVRRPNNDTLYSSAFLDLRTEPIILHVPDTAGFYYVMQIMDAWTNTFAAPGTRTTGSSAQNFAIVGPDWKGQLPRPIKVIKSPTNMVWIIGRTQVNTGVPPEGTCLSIDYSDVHDIQQQYTLTPLSQWPAEEAPPFECPSPVPSITPPERVAQLSGVEFFQMLSDLMWDNPAAGQDMPALKSFEAIGFVPGEPFNPPANMVADINAAPHAAVLLMSDRFLNLGETVNGWRVTVSDIGTYGTNYLNRATIAWGAPGANLPEDGFYPTTNNAVVDENLVQLDSSQNYVIHFDPAPPANAFWSVTVYDKGGYLVDNPICRYAIHSTDQAIIGQTAVDILLQPDPPPDSSQLGFWLPTPVADPDVPNSGNYSLTLRMYWPDKAALKGKWVPPPVQIQE